MSFRGSFADPVCRIARRGACSVLVAGSLASGQVPFTEEAKDRGIDYLTDQSVGAFGVGVCFADLDLDGDPDVVLAGRSTGKVRVYENDGSGFFQDRSFLNGIPFLRNPSGITAADYDGDGDLDLYFSLFGHANRLFRNEGEFTFQDVTERSGLGDRGAGQGCGWADFDGDGWIDVCVGNWSQGDRRRPDPLFRNRGDGSFENVGLALGIDPPGLALTYQASFFDYNLDGRPDLYLCTDKGTGCDRASNHLYENVGGRFEEVTRETGTEACIDCMGIAIADFDGNDYLDLYCTNIPEGNVLLMNQADGRFQEIASDVGVESFLVGWGTMMVDFDNDSWQDIYVCNYGPNRLYHGGPGWPCKDLAPALGVNTSGDSYCVAVADIEGDGDQDLLVQTDHRPVQLFVNHEGERRNWLKIKLLGLAPNTHALGAQVVVRTGKQRQTREVHSGIGFKSMSSLTLHFGLGERETVEDILVRWPGVGTTRLRSIPAAQTLVILEGQNLAFDLTTGVRWPALWQPAD